MNAKARQNNTGRIYGANLRYKLTFFPYQGPPIGGSSLGNGHRERIADCFKVQRCSSKGGLDNKEYYIVLYSI
jgi:hypothetical protein